MTEIGSLARQDKPFHLLMVMLSGRETKTKERV
jgi:hypothetical protein